MSTSHIPAPRIRLEPSSPGWVIAVVDGIRLAATPISRTEAPAAVQELVNRWGEPTIIAVEREDGSAWQVQVVPAERPRT